MLINVYVQLFTPCTVIEDTLYCFLLCEIYFYKYCWMALVFWQGHRQSQMNHQHLKGHAAKGEYRKWFVHHEQCCSPCGTDSFIGSYLKLYIYICFRVILSGLSEYEIIKIQYCLYIMGHVGNSLVGVSVLPWKRDWAPPPLWILNFFF